MEHNEHLETEIKELVIDKPDITYELNESGSN